MNNTVSNYVSPSKLYDNVKGIAKDVAGVSTIEAEVMIDRAGDTISNTIDKLGNTFHKHYSDFVDTTTKGIRDIIRESKTPYVSGINRYPHQPMRGGGDDFMKYVYTAKPIWFTKKDMIWN